MKIINYYVYGMAPSFDARIRKSGGPSHLYERWIKSCKKTIGVINKPIAYVTSIEIKLAYRTKLYRCNTDRGSSVLDMLVRNGVIQSDDFPFAPDVRIKGRYYELYPDTNIILRVDEKHPLNEGIQWGEFNVIEEW